MPIPAMPTGTIITPRTAMRQMSIMITAIITTMSIATTSITTAISMLMTTSKPPKRRRRRAAAPRAPGAIGLGGDEAATLYRLMTWLSPAFPVGAFSWSSGIEWAVEAGDVVDAVTLRDWLCSMLDGPGFCDAVFLAHAHRAAIVYDDVTLREV